MLVLPILVPVLVMGLALFGVLVVVLGVALFSALVSTLYTTGSYLVAYTKRKKAASREAVVPSPVAIPERFKEVEDWPEAA